MGRLREMEMFVRIVEGGSFSAAARDLNMGQPAVSKAIASLEDRLGVRLLVRSTRRLSPTEAGVAFYERALRAIAEANEAVAAAQGAGAGLEGRLRICAPVTFARLHLVPKVGAFLGLGLTFVATGTVWCLFLAVAASHIRGFFVEHPRAFTHLSRASGALFIYLGLRLAASER